jgi:uncharacterized membrane protein
MPVSPSNSPPAAKAPTGSSLRLRLWTGHRNPHLEEVTEKMTIVRESKSVHLDASADTVWQFVSDFGGYASWQPHIASVEMQPNGDRKVNFTRGDSVVDRVTSRDDAAKTLSYGLVPGQPVPMKSLNATFSVSGAGDSADVEYAIEVDVPDEMAPMASVGIGADIDGALEGLKTSFHG